MESIRIIRDQITPFVDFDFFLSEIDLDAQYDNDQLAIIIKGSVYGRTKQRINEFIQRSDQTLDGLRDRVNQTEAELDALISRARREEPGSAPSSLWLDRSNQESVDRHNQKVNEYNNQLELHRRIVDQANRAKERYEDAVEKFNDKKADLENQIAEKLEELKPALDQDILTLLGKMQQLAYDYINNKRNLFAGFLVSYLTKKIYVFIYDRIDSTVEQRAASDIFKKLNDEFDNIILSDGDAVKNGFNQTVQFLYDCYQKNFSLLRDIQENLHLLPYKECVDATDEVHNLLSFAIETQFKYKHIIDPAEMTIVSEKIQAQKTSFEGEISTIDNTSSMLEPVFNKIREIKEFTNVKLNGMIENKVNTFDPVSEDIFFILRMFDEDDQERYMNKYKKWLQNIKTDIEKKFNIELIDLVDNIITTELFTISTKALLDADSALLFYTKEEKISTKKQEILEGIKVIDSVLQDINELPKQKSQAFSKKTSLWLVLSILPVVNIGVLFPISMLINQYKPAFTSQNTFYIELKKTQIKKLQIYFVIHIVLLAGSVAGVFLIVPSQIAYALIGLYLISCIAIYLKSISLKKLPEVPMVQYEEKS